MVLVWFCKAEDTALLGAGFGISRATAYRYIAEGVAVLAAQPIEGEVHSSGGPSHPFVGWLGLTSAIERAVAGEQTDPQGGTNHAP